MVEARSRLYGYRKQVLEVQDFIFGGMLLYGSMTKVVGTDVDMRVWGVTDWWKDFLSAISSAHLAYDQPQIGKRFVTLNDDDFLPAVKNLLDNTSVKKHELICTIY